MSPNGTACRPSEAQTNNNKDSIYLDVCVCHLEIDLLCFDLPDIEKSIRSCPRISALMCLLNVEKLSCQCGRTKDATLSLSRSHKMQCLQID